jgi:hypothetical protein
MAAKSENFCGHHYIPPGLPAGWWQKVSTFPEKPILIMQHPNQPPMYKAETCAPPMLDSLFSKVL